WIRHRMMRTEPDARGGTGGREGAPDMREDLVHRGFVRNLVAAPVDRGGVTVGCLAGRIDAQIEGKLLWLVAAELVLHPADEQVLDAGRQARDDLVDPAIELAGGDEFLDRAGVNVTGAEHL